MSIEVFNKHNAGLQLMTINFKTHNTNIIVVVTAAIVVI